MGSKQRKVRRQTFQRMVVLEELVKMKSHPRAEELYERVKRRIPNISLGTVYRNLHILKEQGLAQELTNGKEASRWEGNISPHYHFVCQSCHRVWDLPVPVERRLERRLIRQLGLEIYGHRLEFYGLCNNCRCKG